ncbi:hypothetical protein QUB30_06805 [Microcoleus sp. BROC3]
MTPEQKERFKACASLKPGCCWFASCLTLLGNLPKDVRFYPL